MSTDVPAVADEPPGAWGIVIAACVCNAVAFGIQYTFGSLSEGIQRDFDLDDAYVSGIFSITIFLFLLCGVASVRLVERVGPRRGLLMAALSVSLGLVCMSVARNVWAGAACYAAGVGFGSACGYAPLQGLIAAAFTRRRPLALGIAISGIGVGTMTVVPISTALLEPFGWRGTYQLLAFGAFVLMSASALLVPSEARLLPAQPKALGASISSRAFVLLYVLAFSAALAMFIPFVFAVPYAKAVGVDPVRAAMLIGVMGIASTVSRLGMNLIASRLGALDAFILSLFIVLVSLAIWSQSIGYWALVLFAVLWGIGNSGSVSLVPLLVAQLFGTTNLARLLGILYTASALGALLGAPLGGLLKTTTGSYATTIGAAFACYAVSFVLALTVRVTPAPPSAPPPSAI